MIVLAAVLVAGGYQIFALMACLFRKRSQEPEARSQNKTGVSVLKPVRGVDENLRSAIASHTLLEGEYELLCGVASLDDPAVPVLREFPRVRVIECLTSASNAKVGVLTDLASRARYPILVVNDSDIRVEPDYLARVTAPLADPRVGLVTCLFRAEADTFAARFEALNVVTDFAPSAMVARLVGVDEFGIGATLAFRKADLEKIGGFAAIADYLADDYQLGHKLHALGLKCVLSDVIVETHMSGGWLDVWHHQVRWMRTIRVSKFWGYVGLPVTFATLWALVAIVFGQWQLAIGLLAVRMIAAIITGWFVMGSRDVLRLAWLIPFRDLFGVAVWSVALFGNSVIWRGRRLKLDRDGRIKPA